MPFSCPNRRTNILRNMNPKQAVHIMFFTITLGSSCLVYQSSLAGRFAQSNNNVALQ